MTSHVFVIDAAHPCLPGHFPGRPLVPGVVILDRVIDAIEAEYGLQDALRLPQVKFVQPLLPGEEAAIVLEDMRRDGAPRWRFRVERAGVLLASGDVVADGPAQA
ncbi:dehydratase [Xanthomonas sp. Mitacek01]|nr:dehydratase [Xanthomonas sp. Mitacek01]